MIFKGEESENFTIRKPGYISKEFIEEAFPNSDVYIFGDTHLTKLKKVTVLNNLRQLVSLKS